MAFVPGPKASRASGGIGAFCPGWSHQPGQKAPLLSRLVAPPGIKGPTPFIPVGNTNPDKRVTLLSRLVVPTGTKGLFCPGWCYQPGQKAPPRDSSKGSYSIQSHVYYLGELVRKPCARQEVLGSNPVVCKIFFNVRHLLSRFCHPGQKAQPFYPGPFCPGWCYQPGQKTPPRDSSKGSYSILSHVYYLGELAKKPCARQEVLGSNPVV